MVILLFYCLFQKELLSLGIDPASYHSEMETSGGDFDVSYSSLNNSSMVGALLYHISG